MTDRAKRVAAGGTNKKRRHLSVNVFLRVRTDTGEVRGSLRCQEGRSLIHFFDKIEEPGIYKRGRGIGRPCRRVADHHARHK